MDNPSIKYFRIYPPLDAVNTVSSEWGYSPGFIVEYRPGEIEERLIPLDRLLDSYLGQMRRNINYWDYTKPFDFKKWLQMQKPITFEKKGCCEFSYSKGDRILIGPWIKSKMCSMLRDSTQWNSNSRLYANCQDLLMLKEDSPIQKEYTESSGLTETKLKAYESLSINSHNPYFEYFLDIFLKLNLLSNTTDLYESNGNIILRIPYSEGEVWDISTNRELLASVIDQKFYRMLFLESKEITEPERTILYEEEFRNRIRAFGRESYKRKEYYQALDDSWVTQNLRRLKREGIIQLDIKDSYTNGNIRYFSCQLGDKIAPLADELTPAQARKIFPEDFYYERVYYQVKEECQGDYLEWSKNHEKLIHCCECNPNNFYKKGSVKYFWVNYYGNSNDCELRKHVLEIADEVPAEISMQLKKSDDLAEYQKSIRLRKEKKEIISPEIRQRRLNSRIRTRELTVEQMVLEMDCKIKKSKRRWDYELGNKELELDDVILCLNDIKLTEDDARCVAISWTLLRRMDEQDISDDVITPEQVVELFPMLWDKSEISDKSAKIIASIYNTREKERRERIQNHHEKILTELEQQLEQ